MRYGISSFCHTPDKVDLMPHGKAKAEWESGH